MLNINPYSYLTKVASLGVFNSKKVSKSTKLYQPKHSPSIFNSTNRRVSFRTVLSPSKDKSLTRELYSDALRLLGDLSKKNKVIPTSLSLHEGLRKEKEINAARRVKFKAFLAAASDAQVKNLLEGYVLPRYIEANKETNKDKAFKISIQLEDLPSGAKSRKLVSSSSDNSILINSLEDYQTMDEDIRSFIRAGLLMRELQGYEHKSNNEIFDCVLIHDATVPNQQANHEKLVELLKSLYENQFPHIVNNLSLAVCFPEDLISQEILEIVKTLEKERLINPQILFETDPLRISDFYEVAEMFDQEMQLRNIGEQETYLSIRKPAILLTQSDDFLIKALKTRCGRIGEGIPSEVIIQGLSLSPEDLDKIQASNKRTQYSYASLQASIRGLTPQNAYRVQLTPKEFEIYNKAMVAFSEALDIANTKNIKCKEILVIYLTNILMLSSKGKFNPLLKEINSIKRLSLDETLASKIQEGWSLLRSFIDLRTNKINQPPDDKGETQDNIVPDANPSFHLPSLDFSKLPLAVSDDSKGPEVAKQKLAYNNFWGRFTSDDIGHLIAYFSGDKGTLAWDTTNKSPLRVLINLLAESEIPKEKFSAKVVNELLDRVTGTETSNNGERILLALREVQETRQAKDKKAKAATRTRSSTISISPVTKVDLKEINREIREARRETQDLIRCLISPFNLFTKFSDYKRSKLYASVEVLRQNGVAFPIVEKDGKKYLQFPFTVSEQNLSEEEQQGLQIVSQLADEFHLKHGKKLFPDGELLLCEISLESLQATNKEIESIRNGHLSKIRPMVVSGSSFARFVAQGLVLNPEETLPIIERDKKKFVALSSTSLNRSLTLSEEKGLATLAKLAEEFEAEYGRPLFPSTELELKELLFDSPAQIKSAIQRIQKLYAGFVQAVIAPSVQFSSLLAYKQSGIYDEVESLRSLGVALPVVEREEGKFAQISLNGIGQEAIDKESEESSFFAKISQEFQKEFGEALFLNSEFPVQDSSIKSLKKWITAVNPIDTTEQRELIKFLLTENAKLFSRNESFEFCLPWVPTEHFKNKLRDPGPEVISSIQAIDLGNVSLDDLTENQIKGLVHALEYNLNFADACCKARKQQVAILSAESQILKIQKMLNWGNNISEENEIVSDESKRIKKLVLYKMPLSKFSILDFAGLFYHLGYEDTEFVARFIELETVYIPQLNKDSNQLTKEEINNILAKYREEYSPIPDDFEENYFKAREELLDLLKSTELAYSDSPLSREFENYPIHPFLENLLIQNEFYDLAENLIEMIFNTEGIENDICLLSPKIQNGQNIRLHRTIDAFPNRELSIPCTIEQIIRIMREKEELFEKGTPLEYIKILGAHIEAEPVIKALIGLSSTDLKNIQTFLNEYENASDSVELISAGNKESIEKALKELESLITAGKACKVERFVPFMLLNAYHCASDLFLSQGHYEKALTYAEEGIKLAPKDPKFLQYSFSCLASLGRFDELTKQIENIKNDSFYTQNSNLKMFEALCEIKAGNNQEAIKILEACSLEINNFPDIVRFFIRILVEKKSGSVSVEVVDSFFKTVANFYKSEVVKKNEVLKRLLGEAFDYLINAGLYGENPPKPGDVILFINKHNKNRLIYIAINSENKIILRAGVANPEELTDEEYLQQLLSEYHRSQVL